MSIRLLAISAVFLAGLGGRQTLAAIDCTPLKPSSPVDTTIEDNLRGHAQVILRSLGSGDIENGFRETQSDTLSKYPHADELLLWRSYIYIACSLMQTSTQWSDDQKYDRLIRLMRESSHSPPGSSPSDTDPRESLNAQSHGFVVQARCTRSGAAVVCTATIVNTESSREVLVSARNVSLYDSHSMAHSAAEISLAGARGDGSNMVRVKLLQGAPAEAVFRFDGIPVANREFIELDMMLQSNMQQFVLECQGHVTA